VLTVIGQLLPLAVAAALSSVPMMAILTILLGKRRRGSALLLMLGYVVGMLAVTGALAAGLSTTAPAHREGPQPAIAIASLVVGAASIAYAVVLIRQKPRVSTTTRPSRGARLVGRVNAPAAFGIGFVLDLRPKALLVSAAAGLLLASGHLTVAGFTVSLLVFVVLGSSTVTAPVVFALLRPETARRPLAATRAWLVRNSRTVTIAVMIVIGTVVIGSGLTKF
jgi:hypothetical protein